MKRLVQVLRIPELRPLLVMNFVFDELVPGFKYYGFDVRVVTRLEDLEDGGLLFIDDSPYKWNRPALDFLGKLCPTSVCICWYWFETSYRPFKYMLHTGEHYMLPPLSPSLLERYNTYMKVPTFTPLIFRPNELIQKIGTYPRNVKRDYCYMGAKYRPDWVPSSPEFTGLYHTGDWNVYLSYDQRKELYLSSTFALGFHDTIAVECGSISARIFEGLTYGCVVFCESEFVCSFTDNVVVHIKSKEDLEEKMRYYKANPEKILEKQQEGYLWMQTKGLTNAYSCSIYLQKLEELYGLTLDPLA